jgi:hypothetical protein
MKNLIIKDLARSDQLDRAAMASVRGGWKMSTSGYKSSDTSNDTNFNRANDSSINATQNLTQLQDVLNSTANGSAFIKCVGVRNDVSQDGQNIIVG